MKSVRIPALLRLVLRKNTAFYGALGVFRYALGTAFQDGVQLDTAILDETTEYSENTWKDIRPGTTLTVENSFVLTSNSIVEFEVYDWVNGTDQMISMDFDPTALN